MPKTSPSKHSQRDGITNKQPHLILATLSLGSIGIMTSQYVIPILLPTIITDFEISSTVAGMGLTLMWAFAALSMYPGGNLSDQLSRRAVLLFSVCVMIVGLSLAYLSPVFLWFVVALGLIGVGVGAYEPTSMATVSDLFTSARGRAYGIISSSYNIGSVVASILAYGALTWGSWRLAFVPTIFLFLFIGWLFYTWLDEPTMTDTPDLDPMTALRRIATTRYHQLLLVIFCLYMFLWQGSLSFYPTLLETDLGFSAAASTAGFASIFIVGLLISPLAGMVGDRFGHHRVGIAVPMFGSVGLTIILVVQTRIGVVIGTVLFSLGLVSFWPIMTAELINSFQREMIGADYGLSRAIFFSVGSIAPTYIGFVADRSSFTVAYAGLVGCFLLAAILFIALNQVR